MRRSNKARDSFKLALLTLSFLWPLVCALCAISCEIEYYNTTRKITRSDFVRLVEQADGGGWVFIGLGVCTKRVHTGTGTSSSQVASASCLSLLSRQHQDEFRRSETLK